ncbi:MAG: phytanoyl-CoA dioxygenase family protein [Gemmatimonadetes bacterium]|nr:phytanoyl-CoA dioxygenase family protein [Gemmatimonadota bacterium]
MPHLTSANKHSFKENGCLIVRGALTSAQIQAAQDALWTGIDADRDDPATWIEAGPRTPVPAHHPAIRAAVHESPLFAMMEEMVGEGQLNSGSAGPALVYPSKDKTWSLPERGHLDGYYTPTNGVPEGTVGYMTINVTIYVEDIDSQGGCFTYWPGSHNVAYEYFKTRSLLSVQGGVSSDVFAEGTFPRGCEFVGQAGDAIFWHGQLFHTGSKNVNRNIRMALIGRFSRKDTNDIRFETCDDQWAHWEGIS